MSRYRWVILGAGTAAQTSFTTISVGLPALAPALRSHYRLTIGEIGVVLGAVGIGMLPTLLPWGLLADRIGERTVIAIGLLGAGAAVCATALTGTYGSLVALLIVSGALGASVNAASGRAVMGWFGAQERGLALGIRQTSVPIGGAAAAAALPFLAGAGGTRLAFLTLGAGCLAGGVVAAVLMREAPPSPAPSADLRGPLRDARMWLLAGGSSLYLLAQMGITTFEVLFLHESRGLSTHAAAAVLAVTNLLGIGTRIGAGRVSDHLGARIRPVRLIGAAITVATLLVALLVDAPLALLVPVIVIAGVLSLTWNGLAFAAAAETAGAARSGAALGFQQTMLGVLTAIVPPLFALVVDASSWRIAFALCALGPLTGLIVLGRVPEHVHAAGDRRATAAANAAALQGSSRAPESAQADSGACAN